MRVRARRAEVYAAAGAMSLVIACGSSSPPQPRTDVVQASGGALVAHVGDREITMTEVDQKVMATNLRLMQELYDARRAAVGELIAEALLAREAEDRGINVEELVEAEITSRVKRVSEEEIAAFYERNEVRMQGQTLAQVGPEIREHMESENEGIVRQSYLETLRDDASVDIALSPPRVPVTVASNERIKGPEDAQVTIVEYSDFQ